MHIDTKNWSCLRKQGARERTIIDPYRKHLGHCLPEGSQYWTLAGQCADSVGNPRKDTEVDQMIKAGLISIDQFHGVEKDPEIHQVNQMGWPEAHWYGDDFYNAMAKAMQEGELNPSIINLDTTRTPEVEANYVARCMRLVTELNQDLLFVANFVMLNPYRQTDRNGDVVMESLSKQPQFQAAVRKGSWKFYNRYYRYLGGGANAKTQMGSFIAVHLSSDA